MISKELLQRIARRIKMDDQLYAEKEQNESEPLQAVDATVSGWLPIATAPKETPVMIFDGCIICVAEFQFWFDGHEGAWGCVGASGYDCENDFCAPTHWMPLPKAPIVIAL